MVLFLISFFVIPDKPVILVWAKLIGFQAWFRNKIIREIGFTSNLIDANSPVGNLSGGERQGVAIARAIYNDADLIILDEPTTALSLIETQKVFDFVNNVKSKGRSVLFIGHNIFHVFDISDRFIILDRGKVIHKLDKEDVKTPEELIKIMKDTVIGGKVKWKNKQRL